MPAPKGNKFAAKKNPKSDSMSMLMRPEAKALLKKIANKEKITMSEVIEKALLMAYPKEFDGLF